MRFGAVKTKGTSLSSIYVKELGVSKNRGIPKLDGENIGKPY